MRRSWRKNPTPVYAGPDHRLSRLARRRLLRQHPDMDNHRDPDILFVGDPHGRFEHVIEIVLERGPDAVVFLGDLQAQRPLEEELAPILARTDVWFIPGNHDTDRDSDHDHLFGSTLADRNLHGRVVTIAGVRIAGLGGVFRGKVWMPPGEPRVSDSERFIATTPRQERWRGGLPHKHRSTIFPEHVAALSNQRADVLVTHEAPSCHKHGFAAIDELGRRLGVRLVYHGHHHRDIAYPHDPQLGFRVISVGLAGITALDGSIVHPGLYETDDIDLSRDTSATREVVL
jgi:predicted phosphodiesterase